MKVSNNNNVPKDVPFHQPDTMARWLEDSVPATDDRAAFRSPFYGKASTLNSRIRQMPPLIEEGLWPAQIVAIKNLEKSLDISLESSHRHPYQQVL